MVLFQNPIMLETEIDKTHHQEFQKGFKGKESDLWSWSGFLRGRSTPITIVEIETGTLDISESKYKQNQR